MARSEMHAMKAEHFRTQAEVARLRAANEKLRGRLEETNARLRKLEKVVRVISPWNMQGFSDLDEEPPVPKGKIICLAAGKGAAAMAARTRPRIRCLFMPSPL